MQQFISRNLRSFNRFFEIVIPVTTWAIITLPLWLSFFHPAVVAYFILTFDVYFFYKSLSVTIFSTLSYFQLKNLARIDWADKAKKLDDFPKIWHTVIITNYKESAQKMRRTLEYLANQDFPPKRILVVLAMEVREGDEARKRAEELIAAFKNKFGGIYASFHPNLPGEIKGKASNSTWAAKFISSQIQKLSIDKKYVTVTSCDADSLLPPKYFSYLTFVFLTDRERYFHFYWAPVLLYSNEDWHIFLQAFFALGDKVKTLPIYLVVSRDAVNSTTLFRTLKSRYEQEKRWAWGVTDVPYALYKFFTTENIPFLPKLFRVFYVVETHLFWPISFFILTLGASIPALVNPVFSRTALGHNLPRLSGLILTLTTVFLLVLIIIDAKSRPKRPASFSIAKTPLLLFQWILLPVVSFLLSSLPALEAHTRLLLGKRLEYKVTEKI